jgi:hypothetical protein
MRLIQSWRFTLEHYMLSMEPWSLTLEHLLLIWSHGGKPGADAFTGDIEAHFVAIHALIRAVEVYP